MGVRRDEYLDGLSVWAIGPVRARDAGRVGLGLRSGRAAAAVFAERFPDPLNDFREVILATAVKV